MNFPRRNLPLGGMFRNTRSDSSEADAARSAKRGDRSRVQIGMIGVVLTSMLVIVALQMDRLPYIAPVSIYAAYFDDAGGLQVGDSVIVAGIDVGTVEAISLADTEHGTKVEIGFRMRDKVALGIDSRAAIKTETVLGRRNLTLESYGPAGLRPGDSISVENTAAPYSLTDALEDATSTVAETDTDQLNQALSTLTETFSETPDEVRGAVDGVARLSEAIANRDNALRELLGKANQVTEIVAERSDQINRLLVDANALLGEMQMRRDAIAALITGTRDVTDQISRFIQENNDQLQPVLTKLTSVLEILTDNEDSLKRGIDELGPYANLLGEAVSSGPYFSSLVGVPTFGDYTSIFMRVLRQKYPQAFEALIKHSGNPIIPGNWSIEDGPRTSQQPPAPAPTYPTPTPDPETPGG